MRLIIILTLLLLFFSTTTFSAEPGFTDKQAKALIEEKVFGYPVMLHFTAFPIALGSLKVIGGFAEIARDFDYAKNEIPGKLYKMYQAWEKVGIIKILESQPKLNLGRQITEIFVTPTDAGEKLAKKGGLPQREGQLLIRQGTFRVDEILKNEARQKGIYNYRIIMATYTAEWTPESKKFIEITEQKLSEKRKIIMLIRFDPFSSTWKIYALDDANKDEDFTTNKVSNALGE